MISNGKLLNTKEFSKYALVSLPTITLNSEEADRFLDYVIDESVWKEHARFIKMDKPEKEIRYLDFAADSQFLHPASLFSSTDYTKEFSDQHITLTSKKVRGAIVIYDDDLQDNIEGEAFAEHLLQMVAKRIANELDRAYWTSNSGFVATDIRSLWDGWRYELFNETTPGSATMLDASVGLVGHGTDFVDAGRIAERNAATGVWQFKYNPMLAAMPSKYKANGLKNLRFFQNDVVSVDYIEALTARSTPLGDAALLGNAQLQYSKVPIVDVPLMPTTYAATDLTDDGLELSGASVYTDVVLTTASNFIIGLQKELTIESKRAPEDEANYVFYSMRVDVALENPEAAVICCNLTHS